MKKTSALAVITLACSAMANGQVAMDWPTLGGDAQRTGWAKADGRITKENVKDFQLVLKRKFDGIKEKGPRTLAPPVVMGRLISYKGFKELAFVAAGSDDLWSIDVDLNRVFWHKHYDVTGATSAPCPAGITAVPSLNTPFSFAASRPRVPIAGIQLTANNASPRPAFAVSSDGKLHFVNTSTGEDAIPPVKFLPPGAKTSGLTLLDGVVYTTTAGGCGGAKNAVWAIDLNSAEGTVSSFDVNTSGLAIGTDGTIYVQSDAGTVQALSPKDLKPKVSFSGSGGSGGLATPVVFAYKDRDLIVSAGADGRLSLLDSQALGTALYQTPSLTSSGRSIRGALASWLDEAGTRWVLAPVWGSPNGSIVAFKLEESNGKTVLTPAWTSKEISSPLPPVIASGLVFVLSAGDYSKDDKPKGGTHATLYALDGATGKEMYSTGKQVTAPGSLTGVTVANGRVYFATTDNTLWAFGVLLEI
ncbi:MAG: PQQ-binding-like beta-propeller repeat protein [Bryobacteraceae bacterium]